MSQHGLNLNSFSVSVCVKVFFLFHDTVDSCQQPMLPLSDLFFRAKLRCPSLPHKYRCAILKDFFVEPPQFFASKKMGFL